MEAVANLGRSIQNNKNIPTPYMLDDASAGKLSANEQIVWLPDGEFIEKLFL